MVVGFLVLAVVGIVVLHICLRNIYFKKPFTIVQGFLKLYSLKLASSDPL
jgi:hypothetical protein